MTANETSAEEYVESREVKAVNKTLTEVSEVAQLCLILCNPMDCSLPGFSVHGILQARILEWVTISFSRDLPNPGIEPGSPALEADALTSEPPGKPVSAYMSIPISQFI